MRNILLFILVVGLLIPIPSCKKGDNDPFLILKTRKSRLVGTYTFKSWESSVETLVEGLFSYRTNFQTGVSEKQMSEKYMSENYSGPKFCILKLYNFINAFKVQIWYCPKFIMSGILYSPEFSTVRYLIQSEF